jgi:psiF repeat
MKACLITALLAIATVSTASADGATLPPVEFDHPFQGKLTVNIVSNEASMLAACGFEKKHLMGCARSTGALECSEQANAKGLVGEERRAFRAQCKAGYDCIVHIRDDAELRMFNRTRETVLRHETGHCNGWAGDHKGAR